MRGQRVIGFVLFFAVYLVASEIFVKSLSRDLKKPFEPSVILVLGANGNVNSPVTQDRVAQAFTAHQKFPSARVLITGNEAKGEITAYRTLFADLGLQTLEEEPLATSTWENIRFSEKLLKPDDQVMVVTSQYHQPRAVAMARSRGWTAVAFGEDPREYDGRIYFFLKERLSNMRYFPSLFFSWIGSKT